MVALTVTTAAVVVTAGAAAPAAAGVAAGVIQTAASGAAATGAAVAGSAGAGMAAGTIAGAAAGGSAGAAAVGAAVGAGGAAAVTSSSAGAAAMTAGIAAGPVGWLALGAETDQQGSMRTYSYDCWKQVLHDDSPEPSTGKLFSEIAKDSRLKKIDVVGGTVEFPQMKLENIWGECFSIKYVVLDNGTIALHAVPV